MTPTRHRQSRWALLALLLAALAPACDAIDKPSELERKIAEEQALITRYSERVSAVDALQKDFVSAWRGANEIKELDAYDEALGERVLPAFKAYVDAIGDMPTESDELTRIHGRMVDAYRGAYETFVAFHEALDEDTVESGYEEVLEAMDAVKAAERTYLEELTRYYERHRVNLVQPPAAP